FPGEDNRVHGSLETLFCFSQSGRQLSQAERPNDHQIHVARRGFSLSGNRAVHKGEVDQRAIRLQGLLQDVGKSGFLGEQSLKLVQEWTLRVRLIVSPVPVAATMKDAGLDQSRKLALQAG